MNRNKICPYCEIEYLPHIEKCADCGAVLLLHEEFKRAQEEKKQLAAQAIENSAVVREGDLSSNTVAEGIRESWTILQYNCRISALVSVLYFNL